jgi:hypothetical protein
MVTTFHGCSPQDPPRKYLIRSLLLVPLTPDSRRHSKVLPLQTQREDISRIIFTFMEEVSYISQIYFYGLPYPHHLFEHSP